MPCLKDVKSFLLSSLLLLTLISASRLPTGRDSATGCVPNKGTFQRESNKQDAAFGIAVYPRIQGGLGNQMFILAAALIVASETNRSVLVNSKQTGVHSFGRPQPVFWHTVFHSALFVKHEVYSEIGAERMEEDAFNRALHDGFKDWKRESSILLSGHFIRFDSNSRYRSLLLQAFEPTSEVQRWVNDAAIQLGLASRAADMPSSLATNENKGTAAPVELADSPVDKKINQVEYFSWCTSSDPKQCEKPMTYMPCESQFCSKNIALHLRLQDSSTATDYWSERELDAVKSHLRFVAEKDQSIRIVIFSNDLKRAKMLMEAEEQALSAHISYSNYLDVVDFFLMSQYFGEHILTPSGSTFQMWAIFLSPLEKVKVSSLPGEIPNLKDLSLLPHVELDRIMIDAEHG